MPKTILSTEDDPHFEVRLEQILETEFSQLEQKFMS
jgi:hypothetical protein